MRGSIPSSPLRSRREIFVLAIIIVLGISALADAGRFLILNSPEKADVILVLAGETDKRPALGLQFLRQGYGKVLVLDVPAAAKLFQWSELDLAENYVHTLPEAQAISICPIRGLSTAAEAVEAAECLRNFRPSKVLLVTSDYHTRRTLSTFATKAAQYHYSVAAAFDLAQFGSLWWTHREWAKVCVSEWARLIWWEAVDHWR